jgi:hypothetical protein
MEKIKFIMAALFLSAKCVFAQDLFVSENASIAFFSTTPVEDIDALSKKAASALNISTGQVYFKVQNTSFDFKAKLMQEHFNENYMESDKFPVSDFNGKILDKDKIDLKKPGTYHVTIEGKLNMHGVIKTYRMPAVIINNDGKINASAEFKVALVDHHIEVPTIVISKIAETIDVKVAVLYQPSPLVK